MGQSVKDHVEWISQPSVPEIQPHIEKQWNLHCVRTILKAYEGGEEMKIEIQVDHSCKEPKIIVMTDQVTDEINRLVKRLSEAAPQVLVGFRGDGAEILDQEKICRIYAEDGKVVAVADGNEYILRLRLYELEERLDKNCFVRISNSEMINLKRVKGFDLSLARYNLRQAERWYRYVCFTQICFQNQTGTWDMRRIDRPDTSSGEGELEVTMKRKTKIVLSCIFGAMLGLTISVVISIVIFIGSSGRQILCCFLGVGPCMWKRSKCRNPSNCSFTDLWSCVGRGLLDLEY